eukprot:CAMPEP_0171109018 /NCGR_PEP_ID=MMETSP0766_2-20121228/70101_1 /TAXON_ID=439317 /ORGANISM="Gambierdiscus australes, Strain CAWD 149" /LENGTH=189 /DNA_ID=CAMNT_0011570665 /DNA_START=81 /DNA_END=647 /DNA_ORIENTATION=+
MNRNGGTRVAYVGNLPDDIRHLDLRYLFREEEGFGRILRVDVKSGPPGTAYAFLDFESAQDAADAVNRRNGYEFEGECIRVELKDGGQGGANTSKHQHRTDTRVIVTGLPSSASWQDLKDHMREAGDVLFVEIERPGVGIVRYYSPADVRTAVRVLDRSVFRDNNGGAEIRVRPEEPDGSNGGRSRSRR